MFVGLSYVIWPHTRTPLIANNLNTIIPTYCVLRINSQTYYDKLTNARY